MERVGFELLFCSISLTFRLKIEVLAEVAGSNPNRSTSSGQSVKNKNGRRRFRSNHFHSHAIVVRFPLLSSILSLYTYTVLFREDSSPVVELVIKKMTP